MRKLICLIAAVMLAGPVSAAHHETKGMIDVGDTPAELSVVHVKAIDGKAVEANTDQRQFILEPGDHELTLVAILKHGGTMDPGLSGRQDRPTEPKTTVITVEAGKRYMIAAQAKGRKGDWEPVIYDERDMK